VCWLAWSGGAWSGCGVGDAYGVEFADVDGWVVGGGGGVVVVTSPGPQAVMALAISTNSSNPIRGLIRRSAAGGLLFITYSQPDCKSQLGVIHR